MHLVVGLGNPGPKYARHRHNLGFVVLDALAERLDPGASMRWQTRDAWQGRFLKGRLADQDVVLLAPLTFMNRSGESVQHVMRFFDVPLDHVLAVHDELDLDFGTVRLKRGGGVAGHNGLRSIVQHGGGPEFGRLRVGIGRPPIGTVHSWVLSDLDPESCAALPDVLDDATRAVEAVLSKGWSRAMATVNARTR